MTFKLLHRRLNCFGSEYREQIRLARFERETYFWRTNCIRVAPTTKDNVFRSRVDVFPSKDFVKTTLF